MSPIRQELIARAAQKISDARALIVMAGAGMGVDSGLPDFRGPAGFWRAYPPIQKLGLTFPEVSTPRWFNDDPEFAWGFFGHRYNLYKATTPHNGFSILKSWVDKAKHGCFVFTSNIDGHFQRSGFSEDRIVECHGNINYLQCIEPMLCKADEVWQCKEMVVNVDGNTFRATPKLPTCEHCGKLARPNVLMFGDYHWVESRTAQQEANFHQFLRSVHADSIPFVVIEIGAGKAVPTVRMTSEHLVHGHKQGTLIRINPREPEIKVAGDHVSLACGGLEALEALSGLVEP